jgi:hypothetical protein
MFSCIILNGMDDGFIENVSFRDVEVTFPGGGTADQAAVHDVPKIAGEYYAIGVPPAHGMYARNVRGLSMSNVRFALATPDARPPVVFDHVEDGSIDGLKVQGEVRMVECKDVLTTPRK